MSEDVFQNFLQQESTGMMQDSIIRQIRVLWYTVRNKAARALPPEGFVRQERKEKS